MTVPCFFIEDRGRVNVQDLYNSDSYWPEELCQAIYFKTPRHVMGVRCTLQAGHYPDTKHQTATGIEWEDRVPSKETIAVIATSMEAGKTYIEELGLENCEVFIDQRHLHGRKIKGVIITPGYLLWMFERAISPMAIINASLIEAERLNSPMG